MSASKPISFVFPFCLYITIMLSHIYPSARPRLHHHASRSSSLGPVASVEVAVAYCLSQMLRQHTF